MDDDSIELRRKKKNAEKAARWRQRHPERAKESQRRHREKNAEKRASQAAEWRSRNAEHVKAYQREYEAARAETRAAEKRATYAANPGRDRQASKEWRDANPDRVREHRRQWRARRHKADGTHTIREIEALREIQDHRCANPHCRCELTIGNWALDHIVPLSRGGSDGIDNLQWLCRPCNMRKSDLDLATWLEREARRAA